MANKQEKFKKLLGFVSKSKPPFGTECLCIERNFKSIYLFALEPKQRNEFDSLLIDLLDSAHKFSIKFLEEYFFDYIIQSSKFELNELVSNLSKFPKIKKDIFIGLNDINVNSSYKFGCFQIIPISEFENILKLHYQKLKSKNPAKTIYQEDEFLRFILGERKYKNSILKVTIEAYDDYKFQELAHKKFSDFDKLLSFACYPSAGRQIAATISPNHNQEEIISLSDMNCIKNTGLSSKAILSTTNIDSILHAMSHIGVGFIWDLYCKENRNEIENRIVTAAIWIGMANNEEEKTISFTEYCFALEALLKFDTGKLLSPGIGYSISESAAFIISKKFQERKDIKSRINDLYSLRSAIVHGGDKKVLDSDLKEILTIVMLLIIHLYHDNWIKLNKMEKLFEKIDEIRLGKKLD